MSTWNGGKIALPLTERALAALRVAPGVGVDTPADREVYRTANNVVEVVHAPAASRIVSQGGVLLYAFSAAAPSVSNGTAADSGDYVWRGNSTKLITCTVGGTVSATWTTNIAAGAYDPSKGYVVGIWRGNETSSSGCSISIAGSGGKSQSWSVSGTGLRPGWNMIYLCSPTDTVAQGTGLPVGYGSQSGVVNLGGAGGGGMANTPITSISVAFFSATIGDTWCVDTIESATKIRPAVVFTYDQAYTDSGNPFLNQIIPAFSEYGLVGACRFHSLVDSPNASANCLSALAAGWDIVNGTLTRATPVTTIPAIVKEYAVNQNKMTAAGLGHSFWANPPGNNSSSDNANGRATFPRLGIEYSKGTSHSAIYQGVQGIGNPYSLGVTGLDGLTGAQIAGYINAAVASGTHLMFISHYLQGAQTLAELKIGLAYAAAAQAAGQIDVVHLTGFRGILRGYA